MARHKAVLQTTTKSLAVNAQSIDISDLTDLVEVRRIWYIDDNERQIITRKERDRFNEIYSEDSSGEPSFYNNKDDSTIEFDIKNDEARTLYIEYFGNSSAITTSSSISLRDDIIEILKDGALAYVWDNMEDEVKSGKAEDRFVAVLSKLEDDYEREEYPDYIEETE